MRIIADFHIHSKYARSTSRDMNLEELDKWAQVKGVRVLGTGDFTHPLWFRELREKLEGAEPGLFKLRKGSEKNFTRFILTVEVSSIYSKGGKVRKIHTIIFAPSFEAADKINTQLGWVGNLAADGRPILGLDAKELAKIVFGASENCLLVPAHAWTPWFSVFGSKSGFDSIEECFEEYAKYIYAIETGLSSDPLMNWRVSALDNITLLSNSDCHSPSRIGREANVFEANELSYQNIITAIKNGGRSESPNCKLAYTVEFYPEEGKYHFDGHRNCKFSSPPEKTKELEGTCPQCGRSLTIGVLSRVEELADRAPGERPAGAIPYKSLVPLDEIIGETLGVGKASKAVKKEYNDLIKRFGNEFTILLDASCEEIESASNPEIAEGMMRVREGRVDIKPGYDGEYGVVKIFKEGEAKGRAKQASLF